MRFELHLGMDNAAFEEVPGFELARILRELADKVEVATPEVGAVLRLRDINGNRVGVAMVTAKGDVD